MAGKKSVPKKIGERKWVRAVCVCGRRYWTIRELHYSPINGYWMSESADMCDHCHSRICYEASEHIPIDAASMAPAYTGGG